MSAKPHARSHSTNRANAILEASRARLNMLSPKNTPPMATP